MWHQEQVVADQGEIATVELGHRTPVFDQIEAARPIGTCGIDVETAVATLMALEAEIRRLWKNRKRGEGGRVAFEPQDVRKACSHTPDIG